MLQVVFPAGSLIRIWYVCVEPGASPVSVKPPVGSVQKLDLMAVV